MTENDVFDKTTPAPPPTTEVYLSNGVLGRRKFPHLLNAVYLTLANSLSTFLIGFRWLTSITPTTLASIPSLPRTANRRYIHSRVGCRLRERSVSNPSTPEAWVGNQGTSSIRQQVFRLRPAIVSMTAEFPSIGVLLVNLQNQRH